MKRFIKKVPRNNQKLGAGAFRLEMFVLKAEGV